MYGIEEQYKDNLSGAIVLVNPKLQNDPSNRQGQVGVIEFSDLKADEMYVGFDAESPYSLYSMDALLILKPLPQIQQDLSNSSMLTNLDHIDRLVLKRVENLLLDGGSRDDLIEVVKTNNAAIQLTTMSLKDDYYEVVGVAYARERISAANLLMGEVVIVNPKYITHPLVKQLGQIGIASKYFDDSIAFMVDFGENQFSAYPASQLLGLKSANVLYQDVLAVGRDLEKEDYKKVMQATMLQETGGTDQLILELIRSSESALYFSTQSLEHKMERIIEQMDNHYRQSHGR